MRTKSRSATAPMAGLTWAGLVLATAWLPGGAQAYNYGLVAQAGGAGDSAVDLDDPSASASYLNPLEPSESFESYDASANAGGSLFARANSVGVPPFAAISHRAAARIEETIRFLPPPFPSGPVTVTAGISASPVALSDGGSFASASASVQIEPFGETCRASISHTGETGGSCPAGTVGGTSVTRTFSLTELSNRQWEIDVAAQVEAQLDLLHPDGVASAEAASGLWVQVSSGGGAIPHFWSGTGTNIPVPEPGAVALAATAAFALAALRRRRG